MARDVQSQITTGHVFIGIFGTLSFCMINTVKGEHVSNTISYVYGSYHCIYDYKENESLFSVDFQISEENSSESGQRIAKIWLLIGFVIGFASIIAAIWVMIDDFVNNGKITYFPYQYVYLAIILLVFYSQKRYQQRRGATTAKRLHTFCQPGVQIWTE